MPQKRNLSASEEWKTATKKRNRRSSAPVNSSLREELNLSSDSEHSMASSPSITSSTPRPAAKDQPQRPKFQIVLTETITSQALGLLYLQKNFGKLKIKTHRNTKGTTIIQPLNQESLETLTRLTSENASPTRLRLINRDYITAVLSKVPIQLSAEDIIAIIPEVTQAERCTRYDAATKTTIPTRSMKVSWTSSDPLPNTVKTGFLGSFDARPWTPPPTRCYRCQSYGHVARDCQRQEKCGICAEPHPTKICLQKREKNQEIKRRCANCKGNHVAASAACPVRRERAREITNARRPTALQQEPAPAPTMEDFPELPAAPAKTIQEEPAQQTAQESPKKLSQKPTQKPPQQPTQKPAQKPAKKPSQQPAKKPAQKPAQQPPQKPPQRPVQHPARKSAWQTTQQPPKQPARQQQPATTSQPDNPEMTSIQAALQTIPTTGDPTMQMMMQLLNLIIQMVERLTARLDRM